VLKQSYVYIGLNLVVKKLKGYKIIVEICLLDMAPFLNTLVPISKFELLLFILAAFSFELFLWTLLCLFGFLLIDLWKVHRERRRAATVIQNHVEELRGTRRGPSSHLTRGGFRPTRGTLADDITRPLSLADILNPFSS